MSKFYFGSINLTKLLEAANKKHSGFVRAGEKKQVYVNITAWLNEEVDKYGNIVSIQVNPTKDTDDLKFYIGNLKEGTSAVSQLSEVDLNDLPTDDDFPF